ncbi:conjugal transfer protein [Nocardia sp. NBC_01388]|uniref:conjugal transfer protein n=1 Tax=Nocardia sp. NBC_01388 TaxID=2903596 RepID=UPI0032483CCD
MTGRSANSGDALLRRMAARRRRDNIIVGILAVSAVIGGGHAVFDAFATPPPGPSESSTISLIGRAQLAGSFAREFVVTYLSASAGQQDRISEFVGAAQQITLPAAGRQVTDPEIVFSTRTESTGNLDVWAVTVSVRMPKRAGVTDDARQYYRVAVSVVDGRLRALTVPAAVAPPERGIDLVLAYSNSCAADSPLAQVASGFLQAMLTGSGDIARYTTPDSGIAALRPAPFSAVETTAVTSDDSGCGASTSRARVLASINPKADGSAAPTLAYPLDMVRAAGQWQVRSVESVPALRNPITVSSGQTANKSAAAAAAAPTTSAAAVQIPPATQK